MEWKNVEKKLFTKNAINFIPLGQGNVVTHQRLKLLSIVDCDVERRERKIELHSVCCLVFPFRRFELI